MTAKVIVCEPYFSGSHRAWAEGLAAHSAHEVRLVTHDGGFWKWRMQGAALTLAEDIRRLVADWGPPDLLVASDMVHLPALLGFARDVLVGVPVVVYFHENQMTYPVPEGVAPDETYAMTNWLSMAVADRVVFNSEYHRADVLAAVPRLLRRLPDHRHTPSLDAVVARTSVLPVGIDATRFAGPRSWGGDVVRRAPVDGPVSRDNGPAGDGRRPPDPVDGPANRHDGLPGDDRRAPVDGPADRGSGPPGDGRRPPDPVGTPGELPGETRRVPVVLWNHRWEYDKDPAAFFGALRAVADAGVDFELIVAGESYQTEPAEFARARSAFADRIVWFGTASDEQYPDLLRRADVVVSTARHEFFGVAVVEAITAGALPVLPRRLSYPELVPDPSDTYLYADTPADPAATVAGAGRADRPSADTPADPAATVEGAGRVDRPSDGSADSAADRAADEPGPADREAGASGGAGLVDMLTWALTDHAGRRTAAAVARKHVEQFAWAQVAPRYDALFSEAMANVRPSPRQ